MTFEEIYGDLSNKLIKKNINIYNKKLISLKGSPKIIDGNFFCRNNELTTLKWCPEIVNGDFDCSNNKLTSLKYCSDVEGSFDCSNNKLETLEGIQQILKSYFICKKNNLKTLKGSPKEINGYFDCTKNPNLKNVKEEIIKHQVKAFSYLTDDGVFYFNEIKEEFEKYTEYLLIKEKKKVINKNIDYGLGI